MSPLPFGELIFRSVNGGFGYQTLSLHHSLAGCPSPSRQTWPRFPQRGQLFRNRNGNSAGAKGAGMNETDKSAEPENRQARVVRSTHRAQAGAASNRMHGDVAARAAVRSEPTKRGLPCSFGRALTSGLGRRNFDWCHQFCFDCRQSAEPKSRQFAPTLGTDHDWSIVGIRSWRKSFRALRARRITGRGDLARGVVNQMARRWPCSGCLGFPSRRSG